MNHYLLIHCILVLLKELISQISIYLAQGPPFSPLAPDGTLGTTTVTGTEDPELAKPNGGDGGRGPVSVQPDAC